MLLLGRCIPFGGGVVLAHRRYCTTGHRTGERKNMFKKIMIAVVKAAVAAIAAIVAMWTVRTQPLPVCIAIAVGVNTLMVCDLEMSKRAKPLAQMHSSADGLDIHPRLH